MPVMPPLFRPRGDRAARERDYNRDRGSAAERGYDARWQRAARAHLRATPLCRYCEAGAFDGVSRVTAAVLVDHLYPHRGDMVLFWEREWWVSSCKACHDGPKQVADRAGYRAIDAIARRLGLKPRWGGGSKV